MLEAYRTLLVAVLALVCNTLIVLAGPALDVPADVQGIAVRASEGIVTGVAARAAVVTAAPAVADAVNKVTSGVKDILHTKKRRVSQTEDTDPGVR